MVKAMVRVFIVALGLFLPSLTMAYSPWGSRLLSTRLSMTATDCDNLKTIDVLSLDSIRSSLIRQEETIIFALIERAQFRQNLIVYRKGGFGNLGIPVGSTPVTDNDEEFQLSFLEYMLVGTEALHCGVRRYTSPEEHAFFPERLPQGQMEALPKLQYPQDLLSSVGDAAELNFNKILLRKYIDDIVHAVARHGDDEQHGSTVLCDIAVLQALSRRVHYGKFVAESKYRSDPEEYLRLVKANDAEGVMRLLTNTAVEEQVQRRAKLKAATYGTEPLLMESRVTPSNSTTPIVVPAAEVVGNLDENRQGKIEPAVIESVYRDIIIPLTKVVEVAYLFRRCGREPPPEYRCC
jgi:chorismate mutase